MGGFGRPPWTREALSFGSSAQRQGLLTAVALKTPVARNVTGHGKWSRLRRSFETPKLSCLGGWQALLG